MYVRTGQEPSKTLPGCTCNAGLQYLINNSIVFG